MGKKERKTVQEERKSFILRATEGRGEGRKGKGREGRRDVRREHSPGQPDARACLVSQRCHGLASLKLTVFRRGYARAARGTLARGSTTVHTSASPLALPRIGLWALQTAETGSSSHNLHRPKSRSPLQGEASTISAWRRVCSMVSPPHWNPSHGLRDKF